MSISPAMPLEGNENEFRLSPEQQQEIALIPFRGKSLTRTEGENPITILLHGAPGSGKSREGYALYQSLPNLIGTILVAYDDNGALFDIPAYVEGLKSLRHANQYTYEAREKLFLEYRQDSQRIRSLTFGKVVEDGWDTLIDVTSSGAGTFKMVDALRRHERDVVAQSYWAPIALAEQRLQERADRTGRVLEEAETMFAKRVGAMETLPRMISEIGNFTFSLNDKQNRPSEELFQAKDGQIFGDKNLRSKLELLFLSDVQALSTHENESARTHAGKLRDVTEAALAYLEKLPISPAPTGNGILPGHDRPARNGSPKRTPG